MNLRISIGLLDHNTLFRDLFAESLRRDPQLELCWSTGQEDSVIAHLLQQKVDLFVFDPDVPGKCCVDVAQTVIARFQPVKVVVISNNESDAFLRQVLNQKASGVLSKNDSLQNVIDSLKKIAEGDTCFSNNIRKRLRFDPSSGRPTMELHSPLKKLTPRQLQVLQHLALGATVKEVARTLNLSEKSVDSHKYRLMKKLNIHDRVGLARFAIREGLVSP